jgi:cytochrome c oxidase subunit 2
MRDIPINRFARFAALAALAFFVGWQAIAAVADAPTSTTIAITAYNWGFTPATITVKAGQPVTLKLTSTAGVHGLQSDDLGIPQTAIQPGKYVTVTFTPKKPGTYQIYCSIPCGPGHKTQHLTIVVTS